MEQRLSVLTLGVADLGRARSFYEALGWTTRAEANPPQNLLRPRSGLCPGSSGLPSARGRLTPLTAAGA
jgi:hypothetical protein